MGVVSRAAAWNSSKVFVATVPAIPWWPLQITSAIMRSSTTDTTERGSLDPYSSDYRESCFSAGKSVFLFSPPLILGSWGWRRFFRRPSVRLDAVLFLAIFVAELLLYSKWCDWSSDDAWRVRFMIPVVMLMCIPLIEVLERRFQLGAVAVAGIWVQSNAVLVGGLDNVLLLRTKHLGREGLFVSGRDRVDIEDMRFNPTYSEIAGNWILSDLLHMRLPEVPLKVSDSRFL